MQTEQTVVMPPFDKEIEIKINVDSVYDKLVATFPSDYKHKEMVSHAIIGSTLENGGLHYVYNALCGFTNQINFEVGDKIICLDHNTTKRVNEETDKTDPTSKLRMTRVQINECKISEINLYAADKLRVKFEQHKDNSLVTETVERWVNHKHCTKVPMYPTPNLR